MFSKFTNYISDFNAECLQVDPFENCVKEYDLLIKPEFSKDKLFSKNDEKAMQEFLTKVSMILLTLRVQCEVKKIDIRKEFCPEDLLVKEKKFKEIFKTQKDGEQVLRIHDSSINILFKFLGCVQAPTTE